MRFHRLEENLPEHHQFLLDRYRSRSIKSDSFMLWSIMVFSGVPAILDTWNAFAEVIRFALWIL